MHVLLISFDATVADVHSNTFERMKAYASSCDSLTIICLGKAMDRRTMSEKNITVMTFSGASMSRFIQALYAIYKCTNQRDIDVVSAQEPFEAGWLALMAARMAGCATEVQMHGDFYSNNFWKKQSWINRLRARLGIYVLKHADGIRVVSKRIARSLSLYGIAAERVSVVPVYTSHDTPDQTRVEQLKKTYARMPRIVCVSRLTKEKGVVSMAQAMPYVVGTFPHAQFIIVGDGEQKEVIAATAKSLGVAEHLFFAGHTKHPEDYYAIADVIIIPSHTEGWSRVAVEAAYAGCPIVMTDVGLAGEIITHMREGIIIPANHPAKIAEAVIYMLEHEQEAQCMAHHAQQKAKELPSQQECVRLITDQWKRLTKHAQSA